MNRKEFCNKLIESREQAGCGKNELGRRTGFTFNQTQRLERASNNFSMEKVLKYLSAINSTIVLSKEEKSQDIKKHEDLVLWMKNYRNKSFTQRTLVEQLGCSHNMVGMIERGKLIMHVDTFLKMSEIFDFEITIKKLENNE